LSKKGSVLMISLWILAILVVFALGMGQRAMMNLRIAKYQKDKLRSSCLSRAGILRAIAETKKDTNAWGGLYETWSTGKDSNNTPIYENIALNQGSPDTFSVIVTDEERRININSASKQLLVELLTSRNIENPDKIADLIRDWIDADTTPSGADPENAVFKNAPLSVPEELLLILQYFYSQSVPPEESSLKALEAFNKLKNMITLWGDHPNINTVPEETLNIITNYTASPADRNLVPAFCSTVIALRESQPNKAFIQISEVTLPDAQYANLLSSITSNFGITSNFFRMESKGYAGNTSKNTSIVYDKTNNTIIYRREN